MISHLRFSMLLTCCCLVLVPFFCARAQAAASPTTQLAGRSVTLGLIRSQDRAPVPWPSGESPLETEVILAGPDTIIQERIASNGIDPDSGAYALIYDLNPEITSLEIDQQGTQIIIPKVIPSIALRQMLNDGKHLIVLTVDKELRQMLAKACKRVFELSSRFTKLQMQNVDSRTTKDDVLIQLDHIVVWLDHIRLMSQQRKGPPTSRDTLIALNEEAQELESILQRSVNVTKSLTASEKAQISAIHADLEREVKRYDDVMSGVIPASDGHRCCTVDVSILGASKEDLTEFRVYFTLNGLFRMPPPGPPKTKSFPSLGSGISPLLQPMNYRFWVALDGKPEELLSPDLFVEIYPSEKQKKVQLRLKDPRPGGKNVQNK